MFPDILGNATKVTDAMFAEAIRRMNVEMAEWDREELEEARNPASMRGLGQGPQERDAG
jgi:5,10-methenyltetrahydromethanopterin hydrogenase